MKISNQKINEFISNVNSSSPAILVYGTDYGLVCERLEKIIQSFLKNESLDNSAYNLIELSAPNIIKEPRILAEESKSISLLSNKKIIKINNVSDSITKIINNYLDKPDPESLILIQATSLTPNSSIRRLFENHSSAKIIPCYTDDIQSIDILVSNMLQDSNISIAKEAQRVLVERLGIDRLVTKTEIEKAILFANSEETISYADVLSFVGDQTSISLEKLCDSVFLGDFKNTFNILQRLEKEGTPAIQIIKVLMKQMQNLHNIKISLINGLNIETVINNFKPPIYFKRKNNIIKQSKSWSLVRIIKALSILYKAELESKKSSSLQKTLVRQLTISLCLIASKNYS